MPLKFIVNDKDSIRTDLNYYFFFFQDMETPFMEAVKLALGDRFTEATEKNFQLLFNYVVEQMLIGYNQAGGQPGPDSNRV